MRSPLDWSITQLAVVALIGLVGGTVGGLLGLGGSVFIIPALTLGFGSNQHLYQAAALITNIFVATAATLRHRGKGTIRRDIVPALAGSAAVAALAGVTVSNQIPAKPLAGLFGAYLCYAALGELVSLARRTADPPIPEVTEGQRWRLACIAGGAGGFACGLLGIGGGAVIVPALASSAAVAALAGVAVSNQIPAKPLAGLFGAYLCYAALGELVGLARRTADPPTPETTEGQRWRLACIAGGAGGFACGLLGIGGGAVIVPILRKYGRVPLRQAVASSACAIIAAASIAAIAKNATITGLTSPSGAALDLRSSLELAAVLCPAAMFGGSFGASLVYRIPLQATRLVLSILLAFSGIRMVASALPGDRPALPVPAPAPVPGPDAAGAPTAPEP